jgi:hypothetical protein
MKKKILMLLVSVLALAILTTPVLADPTNGPNKVAVTVTMTRNDSILIDPEPNTEVLTGPVAHRHQTQGFDITIEITDGPTLTGTAVVDRKIVAVPQTNKGNKVILTDYYVFDFGDEGFEGNGKVILDSMPPALPPPGSSLAYGLFQGTGDFEGQTLNIGHTWAEFGGTPAPWFGYWLKYQG